MSAIVQAVFGSPPYRYGKAFVRADFDLTDDSLEPFVVSMLEEAKTAQEAGERIWIVEIFEGRLHVVKKNPHCHLIALSPPGLENRRWRCRYCGEEGLGTDDLWGPGQKNSCRYEYPPCTRCGQTPLCVISCLGMREALSPPFQS